MSYRLRTTTVTAVAIAALTAGLTGPAASASPITDFINSIGTGSTAPGAGAQPTTGIVIQTGSSRGGYVVTRNSAPNGCVTIQDDQSRAVDTGYVLYPNFNTSWTATVDTTKPGCADTETTVSFSGSASGNPALQIGYFRGRLNVACADQSRSCEQTPDSRPGAFTFRIQ